MKNITYISLLLLLVVTGCKKVQSIEPYQLTLGKVKVIADTDNAKINATYTYKYAFKSVKVLYSDNKALDKYLVKEAQFTDSVVTATIDGLTLSSTYFYEFEFDNGISNMWSDVMSFTTSDVPLLTMLKVTTDSVTDVFATSATCGGNVINEGSSAVVARGVCYGLSENPTIENCIDTTMNGSGPGAFTSHLTELEMGTRYYVRAYAINSDTMCYGEQRVFETELVENLPTVFTYDVDEQSIGQHSVLLRGMVTDNGNAPIEGCGFWYSTEQDTLTSGIIVPTPVETFNEFSFNVTGISPGTRYYARAYAENKLGRRFGNEVTFTTPNR